jgi:flagellar biosynthesis chaperone FliJ
VKKYRFRLEAVLRVRRIEEERAMGELLLANRAMAEAEAELDRRLDHYRTVTGAQGMVSQEAYLVARSRQDAAAAGVVAAGAARLAAEAEAERKRAIWAGCATRVRALERLDERRRDEHAGEVLREEIIVLDEVASATRMIGAQR